jgi:hypothetical protein
MRAPLGPWPSPSSCPLPAVQTDGPGGQAEPVPAFLPLSSSLASPAASTSCASSSAPCPPPRSCCGGAGGWPVPTINRSSLCMQQQPAQAVQEDGWAAWGGIGGVGMVWYPRKTWNSDNNGGPGLTRLHQSAMMAGQGSHAKTLLQDLARPLASRYQCRACNKFCNSPGTRGPGEPAVCQSGSKHEVRTSHWACAYASTSSLAGAASSTAAGTGCLRKDSLQPATRHTQEYLPSAPSLLPQVPGGACACASIPSC